MRLSTAGPAVRPRRWVEAPALPGDDLPLRDGGTGTTAYTEAVGVYLGVALSRLSDICNGLCRWEVTKTQVRNLFGLNRPGNPGDSTR